MGMSEEEQDQVEFEDEVDKVYPHGWWILPGIMIMTPFCIAACFFLVLCLKGG